MDRFKVMEPTTQLGRVRFNDETSCIYIAVRPGGYEYEVDLERCTTPGACLDWLHQVGCKNWGREVLADFAKMLFVHIPTSFWSGKA